MPKTEAQKRAEKKYNTYTVERVDIRVPKGEKAKIKEHINNTGESVNAFIQRAIKETMKNDQTSTKKK